MPFTYDLATDIGKVRLLIPDRRIPDDAFFEDAELTTLVSLEGTVRLAAAAALETLASDEAYVQKVQSLTDMSTNGAATAKALLERAKMLRAQQTTIDEELELSDAEPFFDVAEQVFNDFTYRENLENELLRAG